MIKLNENNEEILTIIDFGLSLDLIYENCDNPSEFKLSYNNSQTSKGGSTYYLPPEIMKQLHGKDKFLNYLKSDEFSIGLILYEMTTDKNFYENQDFSVIKKYYSKELIEIIFGLLDTNFDNRLTSYDALIKLNLIIE
jgi:serine/threonine protein kinase